MVKDYTGQNVKLSAHFSSSEFTCKCGCGRTLVDTDLLPILEAVRSAPVLHCKRIVVISGYRCPKHDKAVGGSGRGKHTTGAAADIKAYDENDNLIPSKLIACVAEDLGNVFGIGLNCGGNPNNTHIDARPVSQKWWGDESKSGKPSIAKIVAGCTSFHDYCHVPKTEQCPYTMPADNVKLGSKGESVLWLQWKLRAAGYNVTVDGIFGTNTAKALKQYQTKNGLQADGIAGLKTKAKMLLI